LRQQDFAFHDQTGAPTDPQAGNIPGGPRDVLRSAGFDDPALSGFFTDSGSWTVQNGRIQVAADFIGGDAVSVFHVGDALPNYFELQATVNPAKPTGGWKSNAYVIFDYQGPSDFKFAGLDVALNKLVVGHRDDSGWIVDKQGVVPGSVKADTDYNMLVAINGVNVIVQINNKQVFTHTYQPRIVDGYSYGLNWGMVGVGSDNSRGSFDNFRVQVLPPQLTFDQTETFQDGTADLFTGFTSGVWGISGNGAKVYTVTPDGTSMSVLDLGPDQLGINSYLEMIAKVNTQGRAGFVFDRYGTDDFKFVTLDAAADQVIIGHYKNGKWTTDASVAKAVNAGADHTLGVSLKGTTVSVSLDGQVVLGYAFNAVAVDGNFGLLAIEGQTSFDDVRVKTNDPQFAAPAGSPLMASDGVTLVESASTLTQDALDSAAASAMEHWTVTLGDGDPRLAGFGNLRITVGSLAGDALGYAEERNVWIDGDAAGYGWSDYGGGMDLVSVVRHELGHVLGFDHADSGFAVMERRLRRRRRRLSSRRSPTSIPIGSRTGT
jgi:hypothetical protein